MTDLEDLYALADDRGYDVDWRILTCMDGFTLRLTDGNYGIVLDQTKITSRAEHKTKLGHGLGHAETGSVYNPWTAYDVVQQHENRADKWNILHQVPEKELREAVRLGYTEPWQLAEYFEVTEDLIRQAMVWYKYHTMDTSGYFQTA